MPMSTPSFPRSRKTSMPSHAHAPLAGLRWNAHGAILGAALLFVLGITPGLARGVEPELIAAGVVSTSLHEFSPALSPDGETLYFAMTNGSFARMTLLRSEWKRGVWSTPQVLPFSGVWNDGDVGLAPDGKRLFFISNRPASGGTAKADLDLWYVDRRNGGAWDRPVRLPDGINSDRNEVYPSIAADGTLYFGRDRVIYRARYAQGAYQAPEPIGLEGFSFAIAPDQSFAVVGRPGATETDIDLFWVERQRDGSWSSPIRLPEGVNTVGANDLAGAFSPDGKTLLMVSQRRTAVAWPRNAPVTSYAAARAELEVSGNGMRDLYRVPVATLRAAVTPSP